MIGVVLAGAASGAIFGVGVVYAQLVGLSLGQTSVFNGVEHWRIGQTEAGEGVLTETTTRILR